MAMRGITPLRKSFSSPALEIIYHAKYLSHKDLLAQRSVLLAFYDLCEGDFCYRSFGSVAEHSKLDWKRVRVLTRRLARKGLLVYDNGLFNEDGEVAGAGYTITPKGRAVAQLIREYQNDSD